MLQIHVISHTHWDREWYLTYEQFRLRLVGLVDRLLDLLDANPAYAHFHLDGQTIVLEDYLEIRPEQEDRIGRAIEAGRVLVGPWYVMPDEFLVSGEAIVRNLSLGHAIARRFGPVMPVGYLPDLFGHVGQMPQIWRQFGLDNTILWRGFGGRRAEYWWEAPDGSRVLMMHLPPEGYCNATRIVFDPPAMMARAARAVDLERSRTATGQVLLMNGVDHVEPQLAILDLIAALSAAPDQQASHSTLPKYVDAVRRTVASANPPLDTVTGELRSGEDYANLLPGVLSARTYLKQQNADVQTLLESYAEPLAVFALLSQTTRRGGPAPVPSELVLRQAQDGRVEGCPPRADPYTYTYPQGELRHAWKTLLQNHPHDSICGCSIDAVHDENMTRFARARQVAGSVIESALDAIADSVAAADGDTLRVLACNVDAVERAQVIEAIVDLPIASAEPWRTVDAQALDRPVRLWPPDSHVASVSIAGGDTVPFQVLGESDVIVHEMSRFETPWALHARRIRLLWWAPSLPPCGYQAFDLRIAPASPVPQSATAAPSVTADDRSAENHWLRMTVGDDGSVEIVDKSSGTVFRNVGALDDGGDVGDEYNYCPPTDDSVVTSRLRQGFGAARPVSVSRIGAGPLRSTFRIDLELSVPAVAAPDRLSRDTRLVPMPVRIDATLDAGSPRAAFDVTVDNTAKDHRLRMLFPTGAADVASARADTAFDVVARPARREVPATIVNEAPVSSAPMLSVVDAGGDRAGATVIANGLHEYEIVDGAVALTLIRAVGDLSRNDLATRPSGHAGPPVATPGAQCLGRHTFAIAFEPRTTQPLPARLLSSARAVRLPPRIVAARMPGGTAPLRRSFARVEGDGAAVLSALKKADDRNSVIVRLFNPGAEDAEASIGVGGQVTRAFAVNFLEERQQELTVESGVVRADLKPHQIQTFELVQPANRSS
jgi:mannosylglycerate hydrolase